MLLLKIPVMDIDAPRCKSWARVSRGIRLRQMEAAAGERPSEPGGVEARPIPLVRESMQKKCCSSLWWLRVVADGEIGRCGHLGKTCRGWQRQELQGRRLALRQTDR